MPAIVRKSGANIWEARRGILHAVSWQVRSNVWSPPTDEYETDAAYIVRVEIAGVREDDFEVAVENNILLISGERPDLPERRAFHQMEIRFGRFATAIGIPGPIDVEHASAVYKDRFLTVVLPKGNTE